MLRLAATPDRLIRTDDQLTQLTSMRQRRPFETKFAAVERPSVVDKPVQEFFMKDRKEATGNDIPGRVPETVVLRYHDGHARFEQPYNDRDFVSRGDTVARSRPPRQGRVRSILWYGIRHI